MQSLEDIFKNRKKSPPSLNLERLKTYIRNKYDFAPEINISPNYINIYTDTAAQASVLRLDWMQLDNLIDGLRKIRISIKRKN